MASRAFADGFVGEGVGAGVEAGGANVAGEAAGSTEMPPDPLVEKLDLVDV